MRVSFPILIALMATLMVTHVFAEISFAPALGAVNRQWQASWIGPTEKVETSYGVYHFRRTFSLENKPQRFVVHVSADNRYRLFVNGTPVNIGPARGDTEHWRFDTLDLAPYLEQGRNVIGAQVWNFGEHAPMAQVSVQAAFILQGDGSAESAVNTGEGWVVMKNDAYQPITGFRPIFHAYYVVGPGDDVDGVKYPWGWEQPEFDDRSWTAAQVIDLQSGVVEAGHWRLTPRQIPLMESRQIRFHSVRRSNGIKAPEDFVRGQPLEIPENSKVELLLDQKELTVAYPELLVSRGKGSTIKLTYSEALFEATEGPNYKAKGHRDVIEGKHMRGNYDVFRPDGGAKRLFRPLRWRTYRYVQVEIQTADEPLVIDSLAAQFTAYPFEEHGYFKSPSNELSQIWDISWRTLRVGTHEIFTDCPYYEQLCYVGDTRIQAIVALYVSGDDRLVRKVIEAFDTSRQENGLTRSRWPDRELQIIPPYSLFWVTMVHDYWMLRDDPSFVEERLVGIREVLRYFKEHSDPESGSYLVREWWNFVDWIREWGRDPISNHGGVPPRDENGASAILDLQLVYTLQQAAQLFEAFGHAQEAVEYASWAKSLRKHVIASCWDADQGLIADTSAKDSFSQHAQALLILTAEDEATEYAGLARKMMSDVSLAQTTIYFSFYTHRAMVAAGLGNDYLKHLGMWRSALEMGLSTLPETPSNSTRSDAHAWGAHPLIGMLDIVCGIQPAEPGFRTVLIRPHLNDLPFVSGAVAHPKGKIEVDFRRRDENGISATITLPDGVPGVFEWQGKRVELAPGAQTIEL